MSERIVRRVIMHGRVQGVGFRDWARHVAHSRGIEGWVRNRSDGSVEAVLAGSRHAIDAMIVVCRKGPPSAAVDAIAERDGTVEELALRGEKSFAVLPTL